VKASDELSEIAPLNTRALPSLDEVRRSVDRVVHRWPDAVKVPEDRDRERMAQEMARRVNDWDWKGVKISRITTAAVAVYDEERSARPDLAEVRQFYLDEIAAREPGSFLNAMVWVYVESFQQGAAHTLALAKALARRAKAFGARIQKLLQELPGLFNTDHVPAEVAQIMISADNPHQALKDIGFHAPHGPGLAQHAHAVFVERIAPNLRQSLERDRLFSWLIPENGSALETGAGPAIEALLSVWQGETPPDEVRHEISEAIINAYNDPRLHRGGIWSGFDPELRNVLLRWLTKQDMKFFCDMVSATQNSRMWPPRRDFWLDLYEDQMIDEAWVAFGISARQYAQRHLMRGGNANQSRRFGRQLDRGGNTSLLVMRIGNKIVVDGCHSYKTHIFRQDDPNAPKLYQTTYYCDDIMHSSWNSKPHNSIPNWKSWVMQNV
jgi:hypothetical protein